MTAARVAPSRLPAIVMTAAAVAVIALIGGFLTRPDAWTAALARPSWHPPASVFGPIWAVVGFCVTLAVARAWDAVRSPSERSHLKRLLGLNAILNVSWSALFFVAKRPDAAALDLAALWLATAALIAFLYPRTRSAAMLLLPYIAWLSIAGALNAEIVRLNAPF